MDVSNVASSAPTQATVSVQKSAMHSDEAILKKLYGSIDEMPAPRPAALSTGHNLNISA